jgi:hypothetical protein
MAVSAEQGSQSDVLQESLRMRTASRLFVFILMLLNASISADSLRAADWIIGTPDDQRLMKTVVKQFVLSWRFHDSAMHHLS